MLHQTAEDDDTSTKTEFKTKVDSALPLSMGACESCEHNIDRNRCNPPVHTHPSGLHRMVRCAGAGAKRSDVEKGMVPVQIYLPCRKMCKWF